MDRLEYDRLKDVIERRRREKLTAVESDYLEEKKALEKVWALCESLLETPLIEIRTPNAASTGEPRKPQGVLSGPASKTPTALIRYILPKMGGTFTNPQVRQFISDNLGESLNSKEISSVLNKLRKRQVVSVHQVGTADQPIVYTLKRQESDE